MDFYLKLVVNEQDANRLRLIWQVALDRGNNDYEVCWGHMPDTGFFLSNLLIEVTSWPEDRVISKHRDEFRVIYRPYEVDEVTAENMAATLKRIGKYLAREHDKNGGADAGTFVMRVCRALKCLGTVENGEYGPVIYRDGKISGRMNTMIYLYHYERNKNHEG
jgi:hypothetical protein